MALRQIVTASERGNEYGHQGRAILSYGHHRPTQREIDKPVLEAVIRNSLPLYCVEAVAPTFGRDTKETKTMVTPI